MLHLKIKPDTGYEEVVKEFYSDHGTFHNGDAGLDLFCPVDQLIPARARSVKVPLRVCMAGYIEKSNEFGGIARPSAFYMYPRSSTGLRTPIRLSNSVGIIDAAYRGSLAAIVDNVSDTDYLLKRGERYFQVCAPNLSPIQFELVESLDTTSRNADGFGSTGK